MYNLICLLLTKVVVHETVSKDNLIEHQYKTVTWSQHKKKHVIVHALLAITFELSKEHLLILTVLLQPTEGTK